MNLKVQCANSALFDSIINKRALKIAGCWDWLKSFDWKPKITLGRWLFFRVLCYGVVVARL